MTKKELEKELNELKKYDKKTLMEMVVVLKTMNDLQSQYEPLNTEDGYVDEDDAEAYDEAYDRLKKLEETKGLMFIFTHKEKGFLFGTEARDEEEAKWKFDFWLEEQSLKYNFEDIEITTTVVNRY